MLSQHSPNLLKLLEYFKNTGLRKLSWAEVKEVKLSSKDLETIIYTSENKVYLEKNNLSYYIKLPLVQLLMTSHGVVDEIKESLTAKAIHTRRVLITRYVTGKSSAEEQSENALDIAANRGILDKFTDVTSINKLLETGRSRGTQAGWFETPLGSYLLNRATERQEVPQSFWDSLKKFKWKSRDFSRFNFLENLYRANHPPQTSITTDFNKGREILRKIIEEKKIKLNIKAEEGIKVN